MPEEWDGLVDMAKGLGHVHSQQLVHRDIKPENVLISLPSSDGIVRFKLSDFGLCKPTNKGDFSMSNVKGTPLYLAPEVLKILDEEVALGSPITVASDIFALGCTFFFYLTKGMNPFGKFSHVTKNVASGNPTDLHCRYHL
jgi:serine/threonine protein kinase